MMEGLEGRQLMSVSVVSSCAIQATPCTLLAIQQNLCTISTVTARIRAIQTPLVYRNGLPASAVVHK
jgi:hypothetical protein